MGQGYKGWAGGDKVDWDGVDSGSPTPLERGIYNCVVIAANPGETKEGKPSLSIELEIESRYGSNDEIPKRKLFDTFTMVKDGLFKTKQFCEATDVDPPETTTYGDVSDFAEDMMGQEVYVLVGIRTFEGKPRNRVEFYVHDDDVKDVMEKEANAGDGRGRARSGGRERTRSADRAPKDADEAPRGRREGRRARDEEDEGGDRRESRRARRGGDEDEGPAREERRSRRDSAPTNGASTRTAASEDTQESASGTENVDDEGGEQEPRRARRRRRGRAAAEQE